MIADENIVYLAYGPGVVAVDIAEEEEVWFYRPEDASATLQFFAAPSVQDGQIIIGDYGASGGFLSPGVVVKVYSLKESGDDTPSTAKVLNADMIRDRVIAPPLQVGDTVFIGTADNFVFALSATSGQPVWDEPFVTEHSIWGQPVYEDGVLYVPSLDKNVYALDADTGTQIWNSNVNGSISDRPVLDDELIYVSSFDKQVYALEKSSGDTRWTAPAKAAIWAAPVQADNVLVYVDLEGNVFAVDAESGDPIWERSLNDSVVASPLVVDGIVYLVTSGDPSLKQEEREGSLIVLDVTNGDELWHKTFSAPIYTSPVLANDDIVLAPASEKELLIVFDRDEGERRWTYDRPESE
jgi:outer membrane protein assembly factor BamB